MKTSYRTPNAFFASPSGRRLQDQTAGLVSAADPRPPFIVFGLFSPFLKAFEQKHPEIIFECETIKDSRFLSSLPAPNSAGAVFISSLNASIDENRTLLIKESFRLLKPDGFLFLLVRKKSPPFINEIPETRIDGISDEFESAGFTLLNRKGLLHFPYDIPFAEKADELFFKLSAGTGSFTFFTARKKALVPSVANENYNPARITKASVFTSPRT